ncbi:aminotransferase class I/II-fold pyridoxal phosphate-dependent enzyme [Variovorax sp. RHLX14]|uniref:aminotransferase class I/II-fold pyridoxal phosphate-dependent enzyme n=1 Tax=Variovorax sp. RHLX14 TaxID=1259731 RepID=UPI003F452DAF
MTYPIVSAPVDEVPVADHGGPDAQGAAPYDFSTNGNACGPCEEVVAALQAVDAAHYPDPHYTALRERLAAFHGVTTDRIVIAASASEFIFRITAAVARHGGRTVTLPQHSYGDYKRAADAWGFKSTDEENGASLVWLCDPSSPLGQGIDAIGSVIDTLHPDATCVLDLAYEPMRLQGSLGIAQHQRDRVWQLWTPNKALGLTGVRAAYAIAPQIDHTNKKELHTSRRDILRTMTQLAPSWPLGAHGLLLLERWIQPAIQNWLSQSLVTLRRWKVDQLAMCRAFGWMPLPSTANFFCARVPEPADTDALTMRLRAHGIKLRDTTSFGLPGHFRLAVANPVAQRALETAMRSAPR